MQTRKSFCFFSARLMMLPEEERACSVLSREKPLQQLFPSNYEEDDDLRLDIIIALLFFYYYLAWPPTYK